MCPNFCLVVDCLTIHHLIWPLLSHLCMISIHVFAKLCSSSRLYLPLWKFQAVARCLRMAWTPLPAAVHLKAASLTSSSTRRTAPRRQSRALTPTQPWKLAAAPPQAHRRPPSLWINQSCSAAWRTSSSSSLDSSPYTSPLARATEGPCSWNLWWQRTASAVNIRDQGTRETVLLLSLLLVSCSWNALASLSTSQRATSSLPPHTKSSVVRAWHQPKFSLCFCCECLNVL